MTNAFTYAELHTSDPEKAKAFYRKLFDWKTKDMPTPFGTYTEVQTGHEIEGGIRETETPGLPAQWLTYVNVSDVVESTKKAKELGARPLKECIEVPDVGRYSVLTDPTGALFGLFEPRMKK
jgi:uncharacterized protein